MMCIARTGAQWQRLPDECGKWNSVPPLLALENDGRGRAKL